MQIAMEAPTSTFGTLVIVGHHITRQSGPGARARDSSLWRVCSDTFCVGRGPPVQARGPWRVTEWRALLAYSLTHRLSHAPNKVATPHGLGYGLDDRNGVISKRDDGKRLQRPVDLRQGGFKRINRVVLLVLFDCLFALVPLQEVAWLWHELIVSVLFLCCVRSLSSGDRSAACIAGTQADRTSRPGGEVRAQRRRRHAQGPHGRELDKQPRVGPRSHLAVAD
mmetsp:Transcript_10150/g.20652  ORF Transcript_10150/g.20652 Transcript_10150/m.20652 type:complete len:223 (+) Transcript_10150:215-883(+)